MLSLMIYSIWAILVAYSFWFFFKAKTFQSLNLDDLAVIWKIHKQQAGCKASRIHSLITKKNKVIGFKCDCGYEFLQKRLITQKTRTQTSVTSLASSKSAIPMPKTEDSLQNLGIHYMHIQEI